MHLVDTHKVDMNAGFAIIPIVFNHEDFAMARPRVLSDEDRRERRRVKTAKWRAENIDRSREIGREAMKRAAAAKAIAEGREPGKIGPPVQFTEEQKREKRRDKARAYYQANREKMAAYYAENARRIRAAKKAGTFERKIALKLTDEERRITNVVMSQNRRALKLKNGGSHTKDDIIRLMAEQEGKCAMCALPFGDDGYHVDHYIALVNGGTNGPENLKLLHPKCNLVKGAKDPNELLNRILANTV